MPWNEHARHVRSHGAVVAATNHSSLSSSIESNGRTIRGGYCDSLKQMKVCRLQRTCLTLTYPPIHGPREDKSEYAEEIGDTQVIYEYIVSVTSVQDLRPPPSALQLTTAITNTRVAPVILRHPPQGSLIRLALVHHDGGILNTRQLETHGTPIA